MSLTSFCSERPHSDILIAAFVGFGDRLLGEVKQIAPKDIKIRVRCLLVFLHFWKTPVIMTLRENSWNNPGIWTLLDIFLEFYKGPRKTPGILYDPIA